MGTPLPPNEAGDSCSECWGVGKTFGPGSTPKFIRLTFSDYVAGPLWEEKYNIIAATPVLLQQTPFSCFYSLEAGGILYQWEWQPGITAVFIGTTAASGFFIQHGYAEKCLTEIKDESFDNPFDIFRHGTARVSWNPEDLI